MGTMASTVSKETIETLKSVSCATAWAMLGGGGDYLMRDVFPLDPSHKCVGPAITVEYRLISKAAFEEQRKQAPVSSRNMMGEVWEKLQPGQVIVVGGTGGGACICGDCISTGFKTRGAAGIVTDGLVRDTPFIRTLHLPVFTLKGMGTPGFMPPLSNGYAVIQGSINVAVTCGGVNVNPGDIIFGDSDGVIAIPAARADEVAEASYAEEQLEGLSRKLLLEGRPLAESYPPGVLKKEYIVQAGLLKYWETLEAHRAKRARRL